MPDYTLKDIAARTGIAPRTVLDWAKKDVVRPDRGKTSGSGTPRRYSEENVLEFAVAMELSGVGFTPTRIKELLGIIKKADLWQDIGSIVLGLNPLSGKFHVAAIVAKGESVWKDLTGRDDQQRLTRHHAATFVVLDIAAYRRRLSKP